MIAAKVALAIGPKEAFQLRLIAQGFQQVFYKPSVDHANFPILLHFREVQVN